MFEIPQKEQAPVHPGRRRGCCSSKSTPCGAGGSKGPPRKNRRACSGPEDDNPHSSRLFSEFARMFLTEIEGNKDAECRDPSMQSVDPHVISRWVEDQTEDEKVDEEEASQSQLRRAIRLQHFKTGMAQSFCPYTLWTMFSLADGVIRQTHIVERMGVSSAAVAKEKKRLFGIARRRLGPL